MATYFGFESRFYLVLPRGSLFEKKSFAKNARRADMSGGIAILWPVAETTVRRVTYHYLGQEMAIFACDVVLMTFGAHSHFTFSSYHEHAKEGSFP